jgi:hypothetical protein
MIVRTYREGNMNDLLRQTENSSYWGALTTDLSFM